VKTYDHDYDFPSASGIVPMDNQRLRFNFLLNHGNAFDLSDMGTGKTHTSLWAADYLCRQIGGSVLILAGKTTLQTVWEKTCVDILDNVRSYMVLPSSGERRASVIKNNINGFYITNYESLLHAGFREAILDSDIHTIIVDECTAFKHANTSRSKLFRQVSIGRTVWGLTATPMPNSPLNAYGIARAIRSDYKESFNRFRDRTHMRKDMWVWIPKDSAEEAARGILQPSIRIKREDCYGLPPCTTERRNISLSKDAASLFRRLRNEAFAELGGGGVISVAHEAALRNKLLQVCGGAIYVEENISETTSSNKRSVEHLDLGERAKELVEIMSQTDEKIVVFVPYRSQLLMLERMIKNEGHSVVIIHGDTKGSERGRIIEAFQRLKHPRIMLADPRTMAHGVELTAANIIVWWLPVDSNELYQQAIGRLTRRGQTRHVKVIQLCATPLEAVIYDRLEKRQGLQGSLLEALIDKRTHENEQKTKRTAKPRSAESASWRAA
jgi:SNF2 family DNA or RNA helicase